MRYFLILCLAVACTKLDPKAIEEPLTVERIFASPSLSGKALKSPKLAPNGGHFAYLQNNKNNSRIWDLWLHNIHSGDNQVLLKAKDLQKTSEPELSELEKARRERKRISAEGIVEFFWMEDGKRLLIPFREKLYLSDLKGQTQLISDQPCYDPQPAPDGQSVACVRDYNLWLIDLNSGEHRALTEEGTEEQPIAVADFIAQEEMGRSRAYWWSPDSQYVAYTQVDQRPLKTLKRFEFYPKGLEVIEQAYPYAGSKNVITKLYIKNITTGVRHSISLGDNTDIYLPEVRWHPDKKPLRLSYQIQNRDQTQLDFWVYNVSEEKSHSVLREKDADWVNIRHDFRFIKGTNTLIWPSERRGQVHLWKYQLTSPQEEPTPLTQGDWSVLKLHRADSEALYFTANKSSYRQSQLYRLDLKEKNLKALTTKPGWHEINISSQGDSYLDQFSQLSQPPQLFLGQLSEQAEPQVLVENAVDKDHPLAPYWNDLGQWHFGEFSHEEVDLAYSLLLPANFKGSHKYPLIHFVYGGPGVQLTRDQWLGARGLFLQQLSQQGFVILLSDNRGTPGRGRDFERAYKNRFGELEVNDQAAIVEHVLLEHPFIDTERLGAFGHSYGGYLTLMLMMQKPSLYKVGVAGAPVVDWSLYDTHYTERYLGHPQENVETYKKANVLTHTDGLKGRLLVLHGMADDNVLYTHSTQLYEQLQKQQKLFDIMVYPGAKHSLRESRDLQIHHHKTLLDYFHRHL